MHFQKWHTGGKTVYNNGQVTALNNRNHKYLGLQSNNTAKQLQELDQLLSLLYSPFNDKQ